MDTHQVSVWLLILLRNPLEIEREFSSDQKEVGITVPGVRACPMEKKIIWG